MTIWDPDFYKAGYEGYKSAGAFPTAESLEDYRRLLREKTQQQVSFIARHLGARKLRVIEFGSGNSRLLVAMALEGLLASGVGVDISESRVTFARRWCEDLGLSNIVNVCDDVLTFDDFAATEFDLAVCITGAFGYLRPISESAPETVLRKFHRGLHDKGHLLLELHQMPASGESCWSCLMANCAGGIHCLPQIASLIT